MKWQEFRDLFVQRYEGVETPAGIVLNMFSGGPRPSECLTVYASRQVTALLSKWKQMSNEEIAVSVVLAHTAQLDNRLQRLLFTTNISTRSEMEQQLRAYAYGKRSDGKTLDYISGPERKKRCPSHVKCHFCGKSGQGSWNAAAGFQQNQVHPRIILLAATPLRRGTCPTGPATSVASWAILQQLALRILSLQAKETRMRSE
jgi:hypothetical protein